MDGPPARAEAERGQGRDPGDAGGKGSAVAHEASKRVVPS